MKIKISILSLVIGLTANAMAQSAPPAGTQPGSATIAPGNSGQTISSQNGSQVNGVIPGISTNNINPANTNGFNGNNGTNNGNGMTNGVNGNPYATYTNPNAIYTNPNSIYINPNSTNINPNYTYPGTNLSNANTNSMNTDTNSHHWWKW